MLIWVWVALPERPPQTGSETLLAGAGNDLALAVESDFKPCSVPGFRNLAGMRCHDVSKSRLQASGSKLASSIVYFVEFRSMERCHRARLFMMRNYAKFLCEYVNANFGWQLSSGIRLTGGVW